MRILKWVVAIVVLGWLGGKAVAFSSYAMAYWKERAAQANGYKFDRPIATVAEFQAAIYLRKVMAQNHCQALGFDFAEERFYKAAATLGFTRARALEKSDLEYLFNTVERALPRNPNSGDVPCSSMYSRLVAAVPDGAVKTH